MREYQKTLSPADLEILQNHLNQNGMPDAKILGKPIELSGGRSKSTYLLETTEGNVVTSCFVPNRHRRSMPETTAQLQAALYDKGVSVPELIGEMGQLDDGTSFSVEKFISGEHLSKLNGLQAKNFGAELAKLHVAAEDISMSSPGQQATTKAKKIKDYGDVTVRTAKQMAHSIASGKPKATINTAHYFSTVLQGKLNKTNLPRQAIHNDIRPANVIFKGDRPVFIDWDLSAEGRCVDDIASALTTHFLFPQKSRETIDDSGMRSFLRAYNEIRPLQEEELKALPYLIKRRCFSYGLDPFSEHSRDETDRVFSSVRSWLDKADFSNLLQRGHRINLNTERAGQKLQGMTP